MARAATAGELVSLRSANQAVRYYLAIAHPSTVFACLLNGVPSSNDSVVELTYDGVTTGVTGDVHPGMTMLVGSTLGGEELGRCRIRKVPNGTTLYIGAVSDIEWADNCYLTVTDDYDLWAIPNRLDTNDPLIEYVDEEAYTDQHENFAPVVIMGPPSVKWMTPGNPSPTVRHYHDATDSWVIGSSISTYAWDFIDGLGGDPSAASTFAAYNTPGERTISLTVTAANGKSTTRYQRNWSFLANVSEPVTQFELTASPEGSVERGGWGFGVKLYDSTELTSVKPRAMVVLWADDYYGPTSAGKTGIGPIANRENVVCWGRITDESIRWAPDYSSVEFQVEGPAWWMQKLEGWPAGVIDTGPDGGGVPGGWAYMQNTTVTKGVWAFLAERTTATLYTDTYIETDTRYAAAIESVEASLWQQLTTMAWDPIRARPLCDRYGRLIVEIDSQFMLEADRVAIPTVHTLLEQDWIGEITPTRIRVTPTCRVDLSGVAYDPAAAMNEDAGASAFRAKAPGNENLQLGTVELVDNFLLADQTQATNLAGLYLGWKNNPWPSVPVKLASNHRLLDICPRQYAAINLTAGDDVRGVALNERLIPRAVRLVWDQDGRYSLTECEFEAEAHPGSSIAYEPPVVTPPEPKPILAFTTTRVGYCEHPEAASPVWVNKTGNLAGRTIYDGAPNPWDVLHSAYVATDTGIFRTDNLDASPPTWTNVFDLTAAIANTADADPANGEGNFTCLQVRPSPAENGLVGIGYTLRTAFGPGYTGAVCVNHSHNSGATWGTGVTLAYTDKIALAVSGRSASNAWAVANFQGSSAWNGMHVSTNGMHSFTNTINKFDADGTVFTLVVPFMGMDDDLLTGDSTGATPSATLFRSTDSGASLSSVMPLYDTYNWGVVQGAGALDIYQQDGLQGFGCFKPDLGSATDYHFFTSTDGGATWSHKAATPAGKLYNAITIHPYDARQIYAMSLTGTTKRIELSIDSGTTWRDITGNWAAVMTSALDLPAERCQHAVIPLL